MLLLFANFFLVGWHSKIIQSNLGIRNVMPIWAFVMVIDALK